MKILKTSCTRVHGFEQKSKLCVRTRGFEKIYLFSSKGNLISSQPRLSFDLNLQLGSSGVLSNDFHGVGVGPLSKILAVNATPIQHHCAMLGSQMVYPFTNSETDQL